jgi:hypothetical protein
MSYCAIEEAFMPLVPGGQSTKKSKKNRTMVVPSAPAGSDQEAKEYSLGETIEMADLSGRDLSGRDLSGRDPSGRDPSGRDPDRPAQRPPPANDILSSPASNGRLDSLSSSPSDFFPMQGNNAEPEAWQKAFLLGDMSSSVQKPSFQVDQKPTLWRSITKPVTSAISSTSTAFVDTLAPITGPDEIGRRLDSLSKQLDSLTFVTPMQNTAELFLFVAIGLLLLLAIDTLLRYATATASATASSSPLQVMSGGGYRGLGRRGLGRRHT